MTDAPLTGDELDRVRDNEQPGGSGCGAVPRLATLDEYLRDAKREQKGARMGSLVRLHRR